MKINPFIVFSIIVFFLLPLTISPFLNITSIEDLALDPEFDSSCCHFQ